MEAEKIVTASVLIIGNEILSGRTQDVNLNYLAKGLNEAGVRLLEARVVPDVPEAIVAAVNEVRARYDYVFTTGGIGPTHDDITSECVARAFGVPLILHPEAARILEAHYQKRGLEFNAARRRMAQVPEGAELVLNAVSLAPGFRIGNVYVLAGVPQVMQAMFESLKGGLRGGRPVLSRTISCGLAEGALAEGLGAIQARHPDVDIGSYPWYRRGAYGVSLALRSPEPARLAAAGDEVAALVRALGGTPVEE
ncbi:MAG TPA: competence/damage-inducible protein A [Stellaceae bacterium]|nr:competence/damage-inducible protein A [Stellaceae bacterium]